MYHLLSVGGIYRHPNGNSSHFVKDLENIGNDVTTILTGDLNIDMIKIENEITLGYVSTLMSYGYLPYITLPSGIILCNLYRPYIHKICEE